MADVEVCYTVTCTDETERDAIFAEMQASGVVGNFSEASTPTSGTIVLVRTDVLSLVDGSLVYSQGAP